MKNILYVEQGSYSITNQPDTDICTTGMTECIALAFVSQDNESCRLVAHFDGHTLTTVETAEANLKVLIKAFQEKTTADFEIYMLGGTKGYKNHKNLFAALRNVGIAEKLNENNYQDYHDFCKNQSLLHHSIFKPSSSILTLVCSFGQKPESINYRNSRFNDLSEEELIKGGGLIDQKDKDIYNEFYKCSEKIFSNVEYFTNEIKMLKNPWDIEFAERINSITSEELLSKKSIRKNEDEQDNTDYSGIKVSAEIQDDFDIWATLKK